MDAEVLANFELHPIDFSEKPGNGQAKVGWICFGAS